ncbi:MAG: membrane protein [Gemmatales bacterium]|nr:MAG: membrane protein [Gemmatales bacterium]
MDLAWISLTALMLVILASCFTKINPGLLSIVFAWLIAVGIGPAFGQAIGSKEVFAGFPIRLFLTLVGVTLFFTQAQLNGTLERVAQVAVLVCRGNAGLVPVMFFFFALCFAAIGAGNIAAAALIGPLAMAAAQRQKIPAFLMTIMVAHGAIAGALSPISPTGLIVRDKLETEGITGLEGASFINNMVPNIIVAFGGYLLFGGLKLLVREECPPESHDESDKAAWKHFQIAHWMTLALIAVLLVSVIFLQPLVTSDALGFIAAASMTASVILTLAGLADQGEALRRIPWSVILMVCGVTVLTALMEKTEGLKLLAGLIGVVSNAQTVMGVVAFTCGVISVYSSTSGVVLPAFLPMIDDLCSQVPGADKLALASSMIVGGHMVDSSPLSTIGALCIASAPAEEDRRALFNKVLAWGLSMAVVGAVVCYVLFGLL